jgi:hypothetical protein
VKLEITILRHILPILLLPLACAKVTTNYADVGGGLTSEVGGNSGDGGSGTGGDSASAAVGGVSPTGGVGGTGGTTTSKGGAATGGIPGSGGATSAATGGAKATGGTSSVVGAGGATAVSTGGTVATGGTATTGAAGNTGASCSTAAFCDNFEANPVGGPAAGWSATGTWSVVADTTALVADQNVYANKTTGNATSQAGTANYSNASIEAHIKVTGFSSTSPSNSAGVFLRGNGSNDYDLSLGGDGKVYLRRSQTSSTEETCSSGTSNGPSNGSAVAVTTNGSGWFRLKLVVSGTVAAGITITGYVDSTASGAYTQVLQCTQATGTQYMYDGGTAGVFSKGSAPAEFDDVIISTQ